MRRLNTGNTGISFPPFRGVCSQLVIANVAVFFLLLLTQRAAPRIGYFLINYLAVTPALVFRGWIWQLATYSFLHSGVLHVAFNMLTLWFIGSYLESSRGPGWLLRVYFYSAVGGAVLGSLLSLTGLLHSSPSATAIGSDAALFGVLAAFAVLFGDLEMYMFPLPVAIKARYLVMVYMLLDLAFLLAGGPALGYFIIFGGAAIGFFYARSGYVRRSNRKFEEYWFNLRNAYYRWKRRRAARKFQVYMKKRDREVNFDQQGRYIAPDEPRDPTDRKWMN